MITGLGVERAARVAAVLCVFAPVWLASARGPVGFTAPDVVLELPWGSGAAEVSRVIGDEASSEGPMSFAIDADGSMLILDQIASRVLRFAPDGTLLGAVAVPGNAFNGLEVGPKGQLVLLDRLVKRAVVVLDPRTGQAREYAIEGPGIAEGGGVTALLIDADGVWLEYARTHSVRLLNAALQPCPRTVVAGRPGLSGNLVAALDGAGGVVLRRGLTDGRVAELTFSELDHIGRLVELQERPGFGVFAAYHTVRYDAAGNLIRDRLVGRLLDADGKTAGRFESRHTDTALEQYRTFRFTRSGDAYQMALTPAGLRLMRWRAIR